MVPECSSLQKNSKNVSIPKENLGSAVQTVCE